MTVFMYNCSSSVSGPGYSFHRCILHNTLVYRPRACLRALIFCSVPILSAENWAERHKILTGIGAVAAAGAGYEIYEHEKQKYDERRQQGGPPPPGGGASVASGVQGPSLTARRECTHADLPALLSADCILPSNMQFDSPKGDTSVASWSRCVGYGHN